MRLFYRGISYVFYPGSMAVLGLGISHYQNPLTGFVWLVFLCGMVVLPLLALLLFMQLGRVSDIFIYKREQRHGLYLLGVVFSAISAWLIFRENALNAAIWTLCNLCVLTLLFIINYSGYKASAHMAGAAGLLGWILCTHLTAIPLISAVFLVVLVYKARKGLSAHSHFELLLGFCLGLFVTFALTRLLLTFYGISGSFI